MSFVQVRGSNPRPPPRIDRSEADNQTAFSKHFLGKVCGQKGTFRVDCVDRTNVVQTAIARTKLEEQLTKLGVVQPENLDKITEYEEVQLSENVKNEFGIPEQTLSFLDKSEIHCFRILWNYLRLLSLVKMSKSKLTKLFLLHAHHYSDMGCGISTGALITYIC